MDDLIAFVTARLDEDEAAAKAAARKRNAPWRSEKLQTDLAGRVNNSPEGASPSERDRGFVASTNSRSIADHIARHDPARVLREITAKRAVIRRYEDAAFGAEDTVNVLYLVVSDLSGCWSDHPDYRQEWA